MLVYRTPTVAAFKKRKLFHATHRDHTESISDWFKRLQQSITECEYDLTADCILIDKFVSGLDDTNFHKISSVPSWTLEDLILVVLGNEHIFNKTQTKDSNQPQEIASVNVKFETEFQLSDTENGSNDDCHDLNENDTADDFTANAISNVEISQSERIRLSKCEKNKRYLRKLKETGQYDDYKKKQAEIMRRRRLKMKQTEQYLPPELQVHLMNERRRATRERVQRYRDRKSQKISDESNHDPKAKPKKKSKTKSKRKVSPPKRKVTPPKPEFVSEPPMAELENDDFLEPDDNDMNYDYDLNPVVEIEEMIGTFKQEPEPEQEQGPDMVPPTSNTAIKVETPVIKPKSAYVRKRTFECYRCSLPCSKLYELKTHINIFHPFVEPKRDVLNCPYCTKTTVSREILSRHLRKNHADLQVHKCPCCDEEFKRRGQLTEHMSQHRDYRPFICETCAKSFRSLSELNSHQRRHDGLKRGRCDVCGMEFASRSSLKGHMMIHTGERPYPCTLCDQSFRQVSSMRKHLLSVHKQGEKKFVCQTCDKRFASIYHLRIHENIHTGARPYQCDYCGSDFNQPSALKTHVNRLHLNLPSAPRQKKSQKI